LSENDNIIQQKTIGLCVLAYAIAYALLIGDFYHGYSNDTVAYIEIAQKYASGHIDLAINSYWSPLLSWLLVPFIGLKIDPILGIHMVKAIAGLLSLLVFEKIVRRLGISHLLQRLALVLFTAYALLFALYFPGADNLAVLFCLVYVQRVLNGQLLAKKWSTALLAATLFFTKTYCFYFFIVHIGIYTLMQWRHCQQKLVLLQQYALIIFVACLLVFAWAAVLHGKYGQWMLSSAGAYNAAIANNGVPNHYFLHQGLVAPPDSMSSAAWVDITSVVPIVPQQHGLLSMGNWGNIKANGWLVLQMLYGMNRLIWLVLVMAFFVWTVHEKLAWQSAIGQLLLMLSIYVGGYLLLVVEDRYFWVLHPIGLLLSILLLHRLLTKRPNWMQWLVALVLAAAVLPGVINKIWFYRTDEDANRQWQFAQDCPIEAGSRIAEHKANQHAIVAHLAKLRYFGGLLGSSTNETSIKITLTKFDIDVLIVPDSVWNKYALFHAYFMRTHKGNKLVFLKKPIEPTQ
jgi:hypothetical protein